MCVHLGIDLGTSSVKAIVTDDAAQVLGTGRAEYPVRTPSPGWAESSPRAWWTAVQAAVTEATAVAGRSPTSIGLSGQMHGVVVADAAGRALRPAMLWPDTRAAAAVATYQALPRASLDRLANPLSPGMAGPLLRWLAANEAEVYAASRWALQPKDWLRFQLIGDAHGEPSDASATLLYDILGDTWDDEVCRGLDLRRDLLPPLAGSTEVAGQLLPHAAEQLGLAAGIPVAAGAADTAAAALGTGLVAPGTVQLTIGTGGQLITIQDEPRPAPANGVHLYRTALPSGWYAMGATLNAGLALDWVRRLFDMEWDGFYAAAATPITDDDPIFCAHLVGERTPYMDPELRGAWSSLGLDHDRAALLRTALEGVAFALRDALDALPEQQAGAALLLSGGGSRHPAWQQLLADVLDRPLAPTAVTDASSRGAALISALACRDINIADVAGRLAPPLEHGAEPRPHRAALHRHRFDRYLRTVQQAQASRMR